MFFTNIGDREGVSKLTASVPRLARASTQLNRASNHTRKRISAFSRAQRACFFVLSGGFEHYMFSTAFPFLSAKRPEIWEKLFESAS